MNFRKSTVKNNIFFQVLTVPEKKKPKSITTSRLFRQFGNYLFPKATYFLSASTTFLKYSNVIFRPSARETLGSQPRIAFASVISG